MAPPVSRRPVPRLLIAVVRPFRQFFRTQAASGVALLAATLVGLAWANSAAAKSYEHLLHLPVHLTVGGKGIAWPLHHFVNDVLMTVFFLVAGMEIKRELVVGELSSVRKAALPAIAALGGMIVPALIYTAFNAGGPGARGWGIPMATDIAFAVGCIAAVSRRVPTSLVVFLMALAIFDDLGAIVVIALFYGQSVHLGALAVAGLLVTALALLARLRVTSLTPYLVVGGALWVAVLRSGVHATIAGVVLGLFIPARAVRHPSEVLDDLDAATHRLRQALRRDLDGSGAIAALERHLESVQPPLDRVVHGLQGWVAFAIVPLFATTNAGVRIGGDLGATLLSPVALGAAVGLAAGKAIGVFGATWLAVKTGLAPKPAGASWAQVLGVALLAGIGFTMSIFVTSLAFPGEQGLQDAAKTGIFVASLACALAGLALLRAVGRPRRHAASTETLELSLDLPRFSDAYRLEPWPVPEGRPWSTLREGDLRRRYGVSVLGVWRARSPEPRRLEAVSGDERIEPADTLLVVGTDEQLADFLAHEGREHRGPEESIVDDDVAPR